MDKEQLKDLMEEVLKENIRVELNQNYDGAEIKIWFDNKIIAEDYYGSDKSLEW